MSLPDHPITFEIDGDGGILPARVATPLAVVLNELLQNAVDHAYPTDLDLSSQPGRVVVQIERDDKALRLAVVDDGVGLPEGFELETTTGLGLSIVRTLVTTELAGEIEISRGSGVGSRPGTTVTLSVTVEATEDEP
jgi:two-component sensor histidine kinase